MLLEQKAKEQNIAKVIKDFGWYERNFTPVVEQAFSSFWERNFSAKLLAVIDNNFSLFKTEEFFVSKIAIKKNLHSVLRIPKSTIEMLFESLGSLSDKFDITKITELEANIINSFNEYIYNEFKSKLNVLDKKYFEEPDNVNMIFALQTDENSIYHYIITIPKDCAEDEFAEKEEGELDIGDFPNTTTSVDIIVGSAKMSLNDLKNLAEEDIVILDNSNLNSMKLRIGGEETYFELSPDPILIMNVDENGDNEIMDNSTLSQDMWDNIQVEIGVEFDKVKISLGELKQISEGLVVDIASIYRNKVFLKVENKNIAQGELVIVNDRYGVKIDKLLNEEDDISDNEEIENVEKTDNTNTLEEGAEETAQDDFDYSDFEIEDDNI